MKRSKILWSFECFGGINNFFIIIIRKQKHYNGEAVTANGSGNIALVTENPLADNDNNALANILVRKMQIYFKIDP